MALAVLTLPWLPASTAWAAPSPAATAGYVDFQFGTSSVGPDEVTSYHSQSKLWFNDGYWWAVMFDDDNPSGFTANAYQIYRFDVANQSWSPTGVRVDDREKSSLDVYSDGATLYIAASNAGAAKNIRVFRYAYDSTTDRYAGDFGPDGVEVTGTAGVQYAVITKAADALWIAYTQSNDAKVLSSTDGGQTWSPPASVVTDPAHAPIAGAAGSTLESDDVAAVVPVGTSVGVMWTRTSTPGAPYGGFFMARRTTAGTWAEETAWDGLRVGDNHLSVKVAPDGRVIAAVKTSKNIAPSTNGDPLVAVLARSAGDAGTWSAPVNVSRVDQNMTRPMLVLDEGTASADVFMTKPFDINTPTLGGDIYKHGGSLSTLDFGAPAPGTAVIDDSDRNNINNATSTKQVVTASSGLVVLASDKFDKYYLHACEGSACPGAVPPPPPPPPPAATPQPTASFDVDSTSGRTPFKATFTDTSTGAPTSWAWTFGDGGTDTVQNPVHVYTRSGTYQVTLTVTNAGGVSAASKMVTVINGGGRFTPVNPTRVLSGKVIGSHQFASLKLKPLRGTNTVALNVSVTKATRSSFVSVCTGDDLAADCTLQAVVRVRKGGKASGFTITKLDANDTVKIYNAAGSATVTAEVEGWFGGKTDQSYFVPQGNRRVLSGATVGKNKAYTLTIPASLRPKGTRAVALNVWATGATRATDVSVCSAATRKAGCKAHPTLYSGKGAAVGTHVVTLMGAGGKVKLVNRSGRVRLTVSVQGVYIGAVTATTFRPNPQRRVLTAQTLAAKKSFTMSMKSLPAGTRAVALRVTIASATANGSVAVCTGGTTTKVCKASPTVPVQKRRITSEVVMAKVGAGGTVKFYNASGTTKITVDVFGSYGRT